MEPLNKLLHAGEDSVPVVDHTVHIADKAFFLIKINGTELFHNDTTFLLSP